MKISKSSTLFVLIILVSIVLISCEASKKMGCPGAITSKEVKKIPA